MEEAKAPIKVFISYSWDSPEHQERVLSLANTLRAVWGIDADMDAYVRSEPPFTPQQGWDRWMQERIEWADFVLTVCTETYKRRFEGKEEPNKGLGVSWEGTMIRQSLYDNQLRDTKFIPVVFSRQDLAQVPLVIKAKDTYILTDENSFKELVYRLRQQSTIQKPLVGEMPLPSPPEPVLFSPQKPPIESSPIVLDNTLNQIPDKSLSSQKRRSLERELENLNKALEKKEGLLTRLRDTLTVETNLAQQQQLEHQIETTKNDRDKLVNQIEDIEQQLV